MNCYPLSCKTKANYKIFYMGGYNIIWYMIKNLILDQWPKYFQIKMTKKNLRKTIKGYLVVASRIGNVIIRSKK